MTDAQFKIIKPCGLMIGRLNRQVEAFASSYIERRARQQYEMWFMMRPSSLIVLEQIDINLWHEWKR